MSTSSRRHWICLPSARKARPVRLTIGPTGECSPGIHLGYTSVSGPGVTWNLSLAWKMCFVASRKSTLSRTGFRASCAFAGRGELRCGTVANRIQQEIRLNMNGFSLKNRRQPSIIVAHRIDIRDGQFICSRVLLLSCRWYESATIAHESSCPTKSLSFRAIFTRSFPLLFVAKAAGYFRRMDANFWTQLGRQRWLTSATACPRLAARWPSSRRNWLLRTLRNFIPPRRKSLRLVSFRSLRQIFEKAAAFILRLAVPKQRKRPSNSFANTISKKGSLLAIACFHGGRVITAAHLAR